MLLRSAPLSKEVSLPLTSTTETCPTCRMMAEKFTIYPFGWLGDTPILPMARRGTSRIVNGASEKCRNLRMCVLLPHDHAHAAAPALREADAHDFHLRREIAQQLIGGGMKAQGRRDEVDQRRKRLQRHAAKISIAWQVAPVQVMPH